MLLPVDLESKVFKVGINGYDKKDVDTFMLEIQEAYATLYKDNHELTAKVEHLTEALNQYKGIEKSLQKALVLAQKASDDVKEQANQQAKLIEEEARYKAKMIIADANTRLDQMQAQTLTLLRQFELYKAQYKQLVSTQLDILSGDSFNIDMARFSNLSLPPSQDYEKTAQTVSDEEEIQSQDTENPLSPDNSDEEIQVQNLHDSDENVQLHDLNHSDESVQLHNLNHSDENIQIHGLHDSDENVQLHGLHDSDENIQIRNLNKQLEDMNTNTHTGDGLLAPITRQTLSKSAENNLNASKNQKEHEGHEKPKERGYYDIISEIHSNRNDKNQD